VASQKAIDNAMRLRYVRAIERFHKSITSYLTSTADLTKEGYVKKIESALKLLLKVEEIVLYKGDLQELQKLVQKMIAYRESEKEIGEIKEDILYLSNQLEKTKNARRYKKEKHSRSIYEEWE
jgi:hypothetical protein